MDTLIFLGVFFGPYAFGAFVVIAIWGDPEKPWPPMYTEGERFPLRTGAVVAAWPLVILIAVVAVPTFGTYRAGMALHRWGARRREAKRIPRAEVR